MLLFRVFHQIYFRETSATITLSAVTAGQAKHFGATSSTTTLDAVTNGHKVAHGESGAFLTFAVTTGFVGRVKAKSVTTASEALAASTLGTRKRYGSSTFTGILSADTLGQLKNVRIYSVRLTATNAQGSDVEEKTNYVTVRTHHFASTAFEGVLVASTVPKSPDLKHWSVRLTATNFDGADSETKTDYISVQQPNPSFVFGGLLQAQTLGYAKHRGAATSFTGTLTATTTFASRGVTTFTGTLGATTGQGKVKARSQAGWGIKWGYGWGGKSAFATGPALTLSSTTTGSGSGDVLGAFSFTGALSASTNGSNPGNVRFYSIRLTATNAGGSDVESKTNYITVIVGAPAFSFTGTLTAGTAGTRKRYGATTFTGVISSSTASGTGSSNRTNFVGTLTASTVSKIKAKGGFTFTGNLSANVAFPGQLPDLDEFPVAGRNLSELVGVGRSLDSTPVTALNLSEDPIR